MVGANALSTSCCGDCSLLRKVPSHTHNPSPHEGRLRAKRGLRHPGHCEEHLGPRAAMDSSGAGLRGDPNTNTQGATVFTLKSPGSGLPLFILCCLPTTTPLPVSHREDKNHFRGAGLPASPPPGGISPQGQVLANPWIDVFKW